MTVVSVQLSRQVIPHRRVQLARLRKTSPCKKKLAGPPDNLKSNQISEI